MQALFIEVTNWALGERAQIDNSDIEDGNLVCLGGTQHQSLDSMPKGNYEVRVVKDDRDLSQYEGEIVLANGSTVTAPSKLKPSDDIVDVNGVVVLKNKGQINKIIEQGIPPKYEALGDVDISQLQKGLKGKERTKVAKDNYGVRKQAYENGDDRVQKRKPPKV